MGCNRKKKLLFNSVVFPWGDSREEERRGSNYPNQRCSYQKLILQFTQGRWKPTEMLTKPWGILSMIFVVHSVDPYYCHFSQYCRWFLSKHLILSVNTFQVKMIVSDQNPNLSHPEVWQIFKTQSTGAYLVAVWFLSTVSRVCRGNRAFNQRSYANRRIGRKRNAFHWQRKVLQHTQYGSGE